jgi:hypothetical protein
MTHQQLGSEMAWAEDRATQRCDLSADPGAKTGAGARPCLALLPFHPLRDWHESDKPSRQDAATLPTGCPSRLANAKRQEFQFPVNQDSLRNSDGFFRIVPHLLRLLAFGLTLRKHLLRDVPE